MGSTAFSAVDVERLATAYMPRDGRLELFDPPDGAFARPPAFESLAGGLVSSAPDLLRCFCALADGGAPVLTPESLALMTSDALTPAQRASGRDILGAGSWGLATGVGDDSWGWTGGTGTAAYVDRARDTVGVILTQRGMAGPQDGLDDFWAAVAEG
jgi:CubicO group peptidase (beta-lactamase class C family)